MGCPSTPIQGQPNIHDNFSYIDVMRNVNNFVQKLNYIHTPIPTVVNLKGSILVWIPEVGKPYDNYGKQMKREN